MTPLTTLLTLIAAIPPATHLTIDDVRAGMTDTAGNVRGPAFKDACAGGWLVATGTVRPSKHGPAKRRLVQVYRRTELQVPR